MSILFPNHQRLIRKMNNKYIQIFKTDGMTEIITKYDNGYMTTDIDYYDRNGYITHHTHWHQEWRLMDGELKLVCTCG
jgi:hypothetical protein